LVHHRAAWQAGALPASAWAVHGGRPGGGDHRPTTSDFGGDARWNEFAASGAQTSWSARRCARWSAAGRATSHACALPAGLLGQRGLFHGATFPGYTDAM